MSELLAPSKNLIVGKVALYSGADAIYLGYKAFGARAYSDNYSLDDIKTIVNIAHVLNKKIYVTVNTIIKENELEDVYKLIDNLASINVDGIIATDYAVINYIINNFKYLEAHISTQAEVRNLLDALYFEKLGAKRVVLARELSLDEIRNIKNNTNVDLEVFIHGALCVSYSGSCYLSSMLSLRSGNRGRCSQNCRRLYNLYEDNNLIEKDKYLLSMKDLNGTKSIKDLVDLNIASLKIEGRMKDSDYVYNLVRYYRLLMDKKETSNYLNKVFHREYTDGFLNNMDRGNITSITSPKNTGYLIGKVIDLKDNNLTISTKEELKIGDRIKFVGNFDQYLTIDNIKKVNNYYQLKIDFNLVNLGDIYLMKEDLDLNIDTDLVRLDIFINDYSDYLSLDFIYNNKKYHLNSKNKLETSLNHPITEELLYNQFNKLKDSPFYISKFNCKLTNNKYMSVKDINELRRDMIDYIYALNIKEDKSLNTKLVLNNYHEHQKGFYFTVHKKEQYDYLKSRNFEVYYYDELIRTYGDILDDNKKRIVDHSLNVINTDALINLYNMGDFDITLGYEVSKEELKNIYYKFKEKTGFEPNIDYLIYGYQNLMKIKYCPIKKYGKCGKCHLHDYVLEDEKAKFYLLKDNNSCDHYLLNSSCLNLLKFNDEICKYVKRVRFDFTLESVSEIEKIIDAYLNNKEYKGQNDTKGYYLREVL